MTPNDTAIAYLRSKVMSASPEELRLLLLDGALRFARMAQAGLEDRNFEQAYNGFTQCRAIVLELSTTIDTERAPELAQKVGALFDYMYAELVSASLEKDPARVSKVIELLEFERETWVMAMDKLAAERAADHASAHPAASPAGLPRPAAISYNA